MKEYADIHQKKYTDIDNIMDTELKLLCADSDLDDPHDSVYNMMSAQWTKEVQKEEARAIQLWSRNESFLKRKKHEDENNSRAILAEQTWDEKLRTYGKKKYRPRHTNYDDHEVSFYPTTRDHWPTQHRYTRQGDFVYSPTNHPPNFYRPPDVYK